MAEEPANGILTRIPGQYIGASLNTLPAAAAATVDTMQTEIHVPDIGLVRFTARRSRGRHGKTLHVFWTATRAELVDGLHDAVG